MSSLVIRSAKAQASGYFLTSAIFHYLGPSLAVLLFGHIAPAGVAWLRIASAAVVFAIWRRPWRAWVRASWRTIPAFEHPLWLVWGIGIGVCSSVIPYVADQLAMARIGRAGFALMMALLPASATVIGALVLHQIPTPQDLVGIALVIVGILIHHEATQPHKAAIESDITP
jgi:threonine/homoserine efflux transporter RhtA